jgi:hypothetical protein
MKWIRCKKAEKIAISYFLLFSNTLKYLYLWVERERERESNITYAKLHYFIQVIEANVLLMHVYALLCLSDRNQVVSSFSRGMSCTKQENRKCESILHAFPYEKEQMFLNFYINASLLKKGENHNDYKLVLTISIIERIQNMFAYIHSSVNSNSIIERIYIYSIFYHYLWSKISIYFFIHVLQIIIIYFYEILNNVLIYLTFLIDCYYTINNFL